MTDNIESRIRQRLADYPALNALIGTRIYPQVLPVGTEVPAVAYEMTSGGPVNAGSGPTGTTHREFQLTICGARYEDVKSVAAQTRAALSGWSDSTGTPSISPVLLTNEIDDVVDLGDGTNTQARRVFQDFSIWFAQT